VGCIVYADKSGYIAYVMTHYREVCFVGGYTFDATNTLYGTHIEGITAYGIECIGGVYDYLTIA
jgi:hypothetical protein